MTRRTADLAADDLAVIIKDFTRDFAGDKTTIRLVCDLSALDDLALALATEEQIDFLKGQIAAFAGTPASGQQPAPGPGQGPPVQGIAPIAGLGVNAALSAGGQLLTAITQAVAGSYQYSGDIVDPGAITGLDFSVGNALQRKKSTLSIVVDRLEPPARGPVYHQLAGLVSDSASVLQDAIDAEKKNHADAGDDKDAAAEAQTRLDRGNALATTVITFVTSLLTPSAGTAATPIARAEHGARLKQRDCLIVYVRAIESGMDLLTSERLLHDTWTAITGVSVEYAIFDPAGHTLTAGAHTVMQRFTGNLKKGLSDLDLDKGQATSRIHDQKVLDVRPFSDHGSARATDGEGTVAKQVTGSGKALGQRSRSGSPAGALGQIPVAGPPELPFRGDQPGPVRAAGAARHADRRPRRTSGLQSTARYQRSSA